MSNHEGAQPKGIAYLMAVFFGVGLVPFAPGTFASIASLLLWAPMIYAGRSQAFWLAALALLFIIGLWSSRKALVHFSSADPSAIVIDEVVGQGIALFLCPPNPVLIALSVILFRTFDIAKPWPIGAIDRRMKGGLGIMLDDVVAGLLALLSLFVVQKYFF